MKFTPQAGLLRQWRHSLSSLDSAANDTKTQTPMPASFDSLPAAGKALSLTPYALLDCVINIVDYPPASISPELTIPFIIIETDHHRIKRTVDVIIRYEYIGFEKNVFTE